jgi:serine/threonine-protein kinase/endoribonuclease IRE1
MRPSFFLPILLVLATALAETVTLRRDVGFYEPGHHTPRGHSTTTDDALEVLNVILVASVDGKFHALNRTTGGKLWSMPSSPSSASQTVPSILEPLISTKHLDADPDLGDDSFAHETYIVEPQSGDIYVTSSSSSTAPLQRLPFSMTQLVDMSPFTFGETDGRVFVGSKKTSILLLELETGRVKAALDSECPWDAWNDFAEQDVMDIDLDELEGIKPSRLYPSEIFIGRTDYRVSIITRPSSPSSQPPPVQHLSFSTYGPNNQDLEWQTTYHRTVDDLYVESLPNGEVISFKSSGDISPTTSLRENQPVWGQKFSNPIVAIFDVVKSARRTSPFVLLQPRLRLQDIIPTTPRQRDYPNDGTAFVGLVPETGSLFALGPDNFPLVAFSGPVSAQKVEGIEGTSEEGVLISHEDGRLQCYEGATDLQCQTGVRTLRADSASRIARLLDGVPSPAAPPLPSATGNEGRPGNTNSQAYSENEQLVFGEEKVWAVPWQWISSVPESVVLGRASWAPSSSALLLTVASMVGTILWFKRKSPRKAHLPLAEISVPNGVDHNGATADPEPTKSPAHILHSESPVVETAIAILPENTVHISSEPLLPTPVSVPVAPPATDDDDKVEPAEGAEDSGEVKKKPRKRRRRRKGETKDAAAEGGDEPENEDGEVGEVDNAPVSGALLLFPPPTPAPPPSPSLTISETVLGYGSHGTVVYQGSLQGRAVAVKRLLRDFVTLAHREVSLLKDADDHPNVIRYYYQEAHENFLYIALELCPASLADIIDRPDQFRDIAISFNPKRALRQITSGLRHLHALKIVHRDIKPQNILVSGGKTGESNGHRMLISDFGLCRKLELDQTSFVPTTGGAMGVGTFGWRAPEILRGEVKLDEPLTDDHSHSSRGSVGTATGSNYSGTGKSTTRLTKSVDIFALGCLYYYCQTNGGHPFGDRFEREVNIIRDHKSLQGLEGFGEEGSEAVDLINAMLAPEAADRPDTTTCLMHPYFWNPGRRLGFLQDASDRFEIMCRDPRDPHLVLLENNAINVVGPDWPARLDKIFVENLGKFRKYDGRSVQDLLRALRNKKHHYQDLPENVRRHVGSMPEGYLSYFTRRYPRLFLHVHAVIASSSLRQESMFRSYFDLAD